MRTFYPEHFSVEELQLLSVIFLNGGKSKTNSADFLKKNKIWDTKCSAGLDDYLS